MKILRNKDGIAYIYVCIIVLFISECKHFKREGIRKGSLVMIDTRIPFEDGKVNCFVNYKKETPFFQFSRHNDLGEAFEFAGQLCLIVTRVCGGNIWR